MKNALDEDSTEKKELDLLTHTFGSHLIEQMLSFAVKESE